MFHFKDNSCKYPFGSCQISITQFEVEVPLKFIFNIWWLMMSIL